MSRSFRTYGRDSVRLYRKLHDIRARHWRRFLRFGAVGASGIIVNFAILALLVEYGQLTPILAAVVATEGAILSNFTLNDRWTFRDSQRNRSWPVRAWRYHAIAIGGMVLSVSVLAGLVHIGGLHYLGANLFAIGAATIWNYGGNSLFTWSSLGPELASTRVVTNPCRKLIDFATAQIGKVL